MSAPFDVEWHDALPSTNDLALERARAGADRIAVAARHQTAGRGRRGNAWSSPPGAGLYVSFVARPAVSAARSPLLTLLCGIVVHDAFASRLSHRIGLKWPNDVLAAGPGPLAGRKLAGILVESATGGSTLDYAVFGVGVNLEPAAHADPEAAARAVSLAELGAEARDPEGALTALAERLSEALTRAESDLDFVVPAWEARALGLGGPIRVGAGDTAVEGDFEGLTPEGGLKIRTGGGLHVVHTGEVDPGSLALGR